MSELKGILTERETLIGTLSLGADYFKGETGESGVYVGAEQPTNEDISVWIQPVAEDVDVLATEDYVNKTIESKGYMTEEQVRALIAEMVGGGV